jgi:hypothetical protein
MSVNATKNNLVIMKSILIASFLLSAFFASCQVHWDQSSNWTLYQCEGYRVFSIPVDSLKFYGSSPVNQDSMAHFVKSATVLNTKAPLAWMGGYVATCKLNGALRKVEISSYGGYFFDEKSSAYYQLPISEIDAWLSFIQSSYLTLVKKSRL